MIAVKDDAHIGPSFRPFCSSATRWITTREGPTNSGVCEKLARYYCPSCHSFRCGTHASRGHCSVCGRANLPSWDTAPAEEFER